MTAKVLSLKEIEDERGRLTIAEYEKDIPFVVKRIFYMSGVPSDETRGNHANTKSQFLMICLRGRVEIEVDDGASTETFLLNGSDKALFLPKNTWKVMRNFSEDCLLLVLADTTYDATEYIKSQDEFKKYVKRKSRA